MSLPRFPRRSFWIVGETGVYRCKACGVWTPPHIAEIFRPLVPGGTTGHVVYDGPFCAEHQIAVIARTVMVPREMLHVEREIA